MDAAAIEELNKVRKAMGLKPLPVPNAAPTQPKEDKSTDPEEEPASTIETRGAKAGENFKKLQDERKAKQDREARLAAIKRERDKAQRFAVLEGKGLGDLDDEEVDAKSWLKNQSKRQKKIAKARQKDLDEEAAKAAAAKDYSSKDLAGVKVAHDMSTFLDADDQVLTLKDTTVLDNEEEGDELENLNLREQEKLNERLDLKKKRPVYDPNDIDDTGERSILAQYDEEISGKKKKVFTLDAQGSTSDIADLLEGPIQKKRQLQNLDIDIMNDAPISDYLDPSEIKVKKPKKKKSKSTRRRQDDDEDALFPGDQSAPATEDMMDVDSGAASFTKKRKPTDDAFVDDDDLQASLALQRRDALKKRKRIKPEDLAKQLKAEAAQEAEDGEDQGGLILDETTEFLSAIKKRDQEDESERPRKRSKSREPLTAMNADSSEDEDMENAPTIDENAGRDQSALAEDGVTTNGVEEEKFVGQGLGATLSLLKERNIIEEGHGAELNDQFRHRELFLAEQARLIAQVDEEAKRQRERDRASGFMDRLSAREREDYARKANADREFKLSNIRANLLRKYRFKVELKYVDENGRHLNQKEAFKELSHQFHGKTSGKGKTDKKLSKIDQEKRRLANSIFDASQEGMSSAAAQQTKKRKEAGVRLA